MRAAWHPPARMNCPTLAAGLRIAPLFLLALGLPGCAESFAIKNEAVPAEITQQLHAQTAHASAVTVKGDGTVKMNVRSSPPPEGVLLACIGPTTADAARAAGLPVAVVAPERTMTALVSTLASAVAARAAGAGGEPGDPVTPEPKETP